MASSVSKSLPDPSRACSDTKDRAASESYIAELFPHRPPMAMAEAQIAVLKVIVAAQFFSSCYFKVQLLHTVTLTRFKTLTSQSVKLISGLQLHTEILFKSVAWFQYVALSTATPPWRLSVHIHTHTLNHTHTHTHSFLCRPLFTVTHTHTHKQTHSHTHTLISFLCRHLFTLTLLFCFPEGRAAAAVFLRSALHAESQRCSLRHWNGVSPWQPHTHTHSA